MQTRSQGNGHPGLRLLPPVGEIHHPGSGAEPQGSQGGASNSRPRLTSETPGQAGIDTLRLRWRCESGTQERLRGVGVTELRARSELRRSSGGVTVGTFPDGLVYVEGRVCSLLGDPESDELASASAVVQAEELWRETLELDGVAEVGRADVTAELQFEDRGDGLDLLAALRHVDYPWLKVGTEGWKRGELETVYGRSANGRSVHLRVYDKGVESGGAAPGERVRFERQARYRKDRARTVAEWLAPGAAAWFVGRELASLVERPEDEVYVCNEVGALRELRRLADDGRIGWQAAERLVGYVWLRGQGLSRATRYRRESELHELGVYLDRTLRESARVPVVGYIRQAVELVARAA